MSTTPRTDAAWAASFSPERANFSVRDECEKLETELAAAKAECNRLYESSPTALDALTAELARLRAELATCKNAAESLVYGQRAENDRLIDENVELTARAERAEAECLEQARLLGKSGEREADLLGKLQRAEKLKKLWKEFITLMEITEESDFGNAFNPNKISSCRVMDGKRLNEILVEARQIVF